MAGRPTRIWYPWRSRPAGRQGWNASAYNPTTRACSSTKFKRPGTAAAASIAIADALRAVDLPAVEVHISDPEKREPYRHISYTGMACRKVIKGKGLAGYREAILYLKELTEK